LALSSSASSFCLLRLGDGSPDLRHAPYTTALNKHLPSPGMPAIMNIIRKKKMLQEVHHNKFSIVILQHAVMYMHTFQVQRGYSFRFKI